MFKKAFQKIETISRKWHSIQTDLLKDFDCLSHEHLAAKLIADDVKISVVRLTCDCLTNRHLKAKVGNKYSKRKDIFSGVPQGSILRCFSIFISLSYIYTIYINVINNVNYADDATLYVSPNKISTTIASLERWANLIFNCFTDNKIKGMRTSVASYAVQIKCWK